MNLSLYSVNAFLILDSEGQRVLAKYYRPQSHPFSESKGLLTLKEQRAFEKGLWQKTKKSGGSDPVLPPLLSLVDTVRPLRRHHPVRLTPGSIQALP